MLMLPEIAVIAAAFALLAADLGLSERGRRTLAPLALAGLAAAFVALLFTPQSGTLLGGRFAMDPVAWWFKLIFLLAGFITVVLSMDLLDGRARLRVRGIGFRGEYYTMLLFTIAGMMYLISARDLITLYVALELATIPLYALAAWQRGSAQSGEAGMKYVIIGALASAFILYGLGIFYGLTGTTDLEAIGRAVKSTPAFWLAAAMVLTGAGFKLTLVPFHFWAAD
ncbi:MAG: proton-conducting transporter membrane subunit, partial [Planctomycetota bacterium]|nr:proton-conducting transporter membrane subunit [Planctomycetota bacterium]